jgi:uncharacterized protein (DUF2147 family)
MRRGAAGLIAALAVASPAGAMASDPVSGLWRTQAKADGAHIDVRIGPCTDAQALRCGVVEAVHGGADRAFVGNQILRDMRANGPGVWVGGDLIRPGSGAVYPANLTVSGDRLEVRGCLVAGLFCGGQTWSRVP